MDTVSQKYYIKLDKQINCDFICQQLQNMVIKFQNINGQELSETLLILEIKNIAHTTDLITTCRLEYKK